MALTGSAIYCTKHTLRRNQKHTWLLFQKALSTLVCMVQQLKFSGNYGFFSCCPCFFVCFFSIFVLSFLLLRFCLQKIFPFSCESLQMIINATISLSTLDFRRMSLWFWLKGFVCGEIKGERLGERAIYNGRNYTTSK